MNARETLKRNIDLGKVGYYGDRKINRKINRATLDLQLVRAEYGYVFTVSGGFWNSKETDYIVCGQVVSEIAAFFPDNEELQLIHKLWLAYHLSNFKAGTIEQCYAVDNYFTKQGKKYDYTEACDFLKSINLFEVAIDDSVKVHYMGQLVKNSTTLKYGHCHVIREIPASALELIKGLFKN